MRLLSFLSYQAEGDKKKGFLKKASPCRDKPSKRATKQDGNDATICLHHPYILCTGGLSCGVSSAWCVVHVVVHGG